MVVKKVISGAEALAYQGGDAAEGASSLSLSACEFAWFSPGARLCALCVVLVRARGPVPVGLGLGLDSWAWAFGLGLPTPNPEATELLT